MDMNLDIGQILRGILNKNKTGSGGENPYKMVIMGGVVTAAMIVAFVAGVIVPYYQHNSKTQGNLEKRYSMKSGMSGLDSKVISLKNNLLDSKEHYEAVLESFSDNNDLRGLYQSLSSVATANKLVVANVQEIEQVKVKEKAPPKPAATEGGAKPAEKKDSAKSDDKDKKEVKKEDPKKTAAATPAPAKTEVKEYTLNIELKGNFASYLQFKRDLAEAQPLLAIRSESATVGDNKAAPSFITIKLEMVAYAVDKKPFIDALAGYDKNELEHNKTTGADL